jgi:hypothetical protein
MRNITLTVSAARLKGITDTFFALDQELTYETQFKVPARDCDIALQHMQSALAVAEQPRTRNRNSVYAPTMKRS